MKLYLAIFIFLLIIIIYYFINKNIIKNENFKNISGTQPIDYNSRWGPAGSSTIKDTTCEIGSFCVTENGFGLYNKYCKCVVGANELISSKMQEEEDQERRNNKRQQYPSNNNKKVKEKEKVDLTGCYPNTSNFAEICKNENPDYGIKKKIKCDENNSKVECGKGYINGVKYDNNIKFTPCLDKSGDFDNWCKYYNRSTIPDGFNLNSIGLEKVLIGKEGDCYINNGESDNNRGRGVCNYNHSENIAKLYPYSREIDYNKFTECLPLKNTDFVKECTPLLKSDFKNTYALEILSYDCNPGYGRAKCVKKKDKFRGGYKKNYDCSYFSDDIKDTRREECPCLS